MSVRLLEGKPVATRIREDVTARANALRARGVTPHCSIFVGEGDSEGAYYASSLKKVGEKVGVEISIDSLAPSLGTQRFVSEIERAATDSKVHGILVQRPVPSPLELLPITLAIPYEKDVDGASPLSLGLLAQGSPYFVPATAAAVVELLHDPALPPLSGARTTVIGRSAVVGRPVASLLTLADATVTICHSRTRDLEAICRSADILVVAIGKPNFVKAIMVKRGATVIDVGTNLVGDQVVGDVDAASVATMAGALTPVPGGVGVVTTSILLRNVVAAAENETS
jgi:methylenetetrahydrofolate dehydrogenase (NADP+) / methenyltetrahydrofolate cyclohydrolase